MLNEASRRWRRGNDAWPELFITNGDRAGNHEPVEQGEDL